MDLHNCVDMLLWEKPGLANRLQFLDVLSAQTPRAAKQVDWVTCKLRRRQHQ